LRSGAFCFFQADIGAKCGLARAGERVVCLMERENFNSTEKRLARTLLLLARWQGRPT
jgi:hypothetical protein